MTSESVLRELTGGDALVDWFGYVPHFHDANLLGIDLSSKGSSRVRIHTWVTTDTADSQGYLVLDKHVVVNITLRDVTQIALDDFDLPGIIGFLEITKSNEAYRFAWDTAYGVEGSISAKTARFDLRPGKP